jgi:hypothetical protein
VPVKKREKKITAGIFGYGRWAKIYINEIQKKFKKTNISIFTSAGPRSNLPNIVFKKKYNPINFSKLNLFFIVNATSDHFDTIKKIDTSKKKILLEKPFSNSPFDYYSLKDKKNIYLSLQFSFSNYFYYLKKILLKKKEKIVSIKLIWQDSILEKKSFNKKINFIEDAYYHFYSIIRIFVKKDIFIKKKMSVISTSKISIDFSNNMKATICAQKKLEKIRKLYLRTKNNLYIVNFLDFNNIMLYKNNVMIKLFKKNTRNLIKQISYFLKASKILDVNALSNLEGLFKDLILIKNEIN